MSHVYYTELWLATRKDLEKLLELEKRMQRRALREAKEERILNEVLFMYIRYMLGLIKNITFPKNVLSLNILTSSYNNFVPMS
jgi:hypothetical protein